MKSSGHFLNACVSQSVLQQQASRNLKCECNFPSPQANYGAAGRPPMASNDDRSEAENHDNVKKSSTSSVASVPAKANLLQHNIIKKQGVSGESCDVNIIGCSSDILIRKFEKDFA